MKPRLLKSVSFQGPYLTLSLVNLTEFFFWQISLLRHIFSPIVGFLKLTVIFCHLTLPITRVRLSDSSERLNTKCKLSAKYHTIHWILKILFKT